MPWPVGLVKVTSKVLADVQLPVDRGAPGCRIGQVGHGGLVEEGRGLGGSGRGLTIACAVGRNAVESVRMSERAREDRRGLGRVGQEGRERSAVGRNIDVVAGDPRAAGIVGARPGQRE